MVTPHYNLRPEVHIKEVVVVRITISDAGDVVRATAIQGIPELRGLAEEAAMRWTFHTRFPDEVGPPMQIESLLTFHIQQ